MQKEKKKKKKMWTDEDMRKQEEMRGDNGEGGGEHDCDRCEVLRQIVHTSGDIPIFAIKQKFRLYLIICCIF